MGNLVTLKIDGLLRLKKGIEAGQAVLRKPFGGKRGQRVLDAVRFRAADGVAGQFSRQRFVGMASGYAWKKTGPFGTRPGIPNAMVRTGKYRAAWLGGAGTFEEITDNRIVFGVDTKRFPQAKSHQSHMPTFIKSTGRRNSKGQLMMRVALSAQFHLHFPEEFLLSRGFLRQPRGLGVNRSMLREVLRELQGDYNKAVKGRA